MDRIDLLKLFQRIAAEVQANDYSRVAEDDIITNLGIDSLGLSELVAAMERELEIEIPEEQLTGIRTVKQLFELVEKRLELKSAQLS